MNSIDVVLDHHLWKKKIKNPKNYIKKKILKLNKLKICKLNIYIALFLINKKFDINKIIKIKPIKPAPPVTRYFII